MYTRERIEEVLKHVLKYYTFEKVNPKTLEHLEDNTKENFIDSVMMELDNNFPIEEDNELDKFLNFEEDKEEKHGQE